ncbi:unnamed protein product [Heligmosomoides polygyrus]|uniref:tRNA pseudouridine(13) synthase TruD n=1 Tax=Heligmosomoides polygyrus TaxID=6339 RepID=A0A183FJP2_HELPZ|nr:unnamed protein product [Heligmosomoides polygyrus]
MASLSARQRGALIRNKSGDKTPSKGSTMIEAIKRLLSVTMVTVRRRQIGSDKVHNLLLRVDTG